MSGPDTHRFTVTQGPDGSWEIHDARRSNRTIWGRITIHGDQAAAANIVTAMNWHWRWVLTAAEEHAETTAGAVNPALAELIRAARDLFASLADFTEEPIVASDGSPSATTTARLDRLDDALAPFDHLEVC